MEIYFLLLGFRFFFLNTHVLFHFEIKKSNSITYTIFHSYIEGIQSLAGYSMYVFLYIILVCMI